MRLLFVLLLASGAAAAESAAPSLVAPLPEPAEATNPQLECTEVMSSALRASSKADLRGELRRGSEVFYLRLAGRTLNLMTKAEVSLGEAGGHSFSVQVDSASHLVAAGEDAPDSFATLLLNKDSGYAVWSRSRSTTLLGGDAPEVQAVYFVCR